MRPRTLLVLLLLVAGMGAFIWFVDRDLPSSEKRAELSKKILPDLEADQVQALELQWGDKKVRLEREGEKKAPAAGAEESKPVAGAAEPTATPAEPEIEAEKEWRITAPADLAPARADSTVVSRLLDSVLGLEKSRTVQGADPAEVGLDKPRVKLTLVTSGKGGATTERVLAVGAEVPASAETLVSLDGGADAYVVDGGFVSELTRDPGDWRDKRIFTASRSDVEKVTLRGGGGEPVVLARRGEDFWLEKPIVDRADRDKVDRLLGDLSTLSAERFVDHPDKSPADLGLEPPQEVIEAALGPGKEPFKLELGAPVSTTPPSSPSTPPPAAGTTTRYARAGGPLVEVQTQLSEAAERPPGDWQAPSLSAYHLYQVDKATIERGEKTTEVERTGTEWKRGTEKIPYTPVSEFLYALTDAHAVRFVRRTEARRQGVSLDSPSLTVTLEGKGEPVETLQIYSPASSYDGQVPATASGRDFVLLIAKDSADKIADKLDRLEKAEPIKPADEKKAGEGKNAGEDKKSTSEKEPAEPPSVAAPVGGGEATQGGS
jgi:Domain of unknown function (DUF4340)